MDAVNFIMIADCIKCGFVGAKMYFDGASMWCGECHTEACSRWTRR